MGGNEHGHGAAALGRLAGAAQVIAGDIRADDQRLLARIPLDDGQRQLQTRGGRITGLLEFDHPAPRRQIQKTMHEQTGGFGLVHAAFRAEQQQFEVLRSDLVQHRLCRARRQGDDILVRWGDRHFFLAQALVILFRIRAAHLRQRP